MPELKSCIILALCLLASACTDSEQTNEQSPIDHQIRSHEKAKEVEQLLQQADDRRHEKLDDPSR